MLRSRRTTSELLVNLDNLSWKVENKVLQYGGDLSLFCPVDNCCLESAGWGKWISKDELTTIFIDVKDLDSDDSTKYAGGTYLNGFSLLIRNFSREDLNIAYSCTYGFQVSQKKILLWTDAFRSKPEIDHIKDKKRVIIGLIIALSLSARSAVVVHYSDKNMEIVHRLYSLFPIVMLMKCFSKTDEYNLSWKAENKVLQYGDDLSLFCPVDNCCLESAGWGKWTSKDELTTIFIDVKDLDSNDTSKYAGGTYSNGFSLLIRNFSREDLNIAYSCTYGFQVSQKKILLWTDAFRSKPEIDHMKENKPVIIGLIIALSLLLLAVACVVVVVICVYLKKKSKSEMGNKDGVHKLTDESLSTETSEKPLLQTISNPMDIDRSEPVPSSVLTCTVSFPMFDRTHLGDSTGNYSAGSDESYITCRTPSTVSFLPRTIEEE
ncbi:unnamed protein product [Mytilus coruscus]|uniref:Ig-like domain-containing protein n=1 Tax=Mytilus coruscus TaxID=42192 RepID=A0A6J8BLH8_MYTCO|nr:unnamed protein product [Mytilus coruscus]